MQTEKKVYLRCLLFCFYCKPCFNRTNIMYNLERIFYEMKMLFGGDYVLYIIIGFVLSILP